MKKTPFGSTEQYRLALSKVLAGDVPPNRIKLLRFNYQARDRTTTATKLAKKVGYRSFGGVNIQYGGLAHAVAANLGIGKKPGVWLNVLVDWFEDPISGHIAFVLRPEVVAALRKLRPSWAS